MEPPDISGRRIRWPTTRRLLTPIVDSENVESWEERGAKDTNERAFERWNELLSEYVAPPLNGKHEALRLTLASAKALRTLVLSLLRAIRVECRHQRRRW